MNQFARTETLLGAQAMDRLHGARVALFGVGGVGGYAAEALVRTGVGAIDLIDNDTVGLTNLNRQLIALHSTIGRHKVDVMAERLRDINPDVKIACHRLFYLPETAEEIDLTQYDYVIDAIDTVSAKLELIQRACAAGVPVISAMGAGNKLDLTQLRVDDISKTTMCPLARIMRKELRRRGIDHVKVAYSTEPALEPEGLPPEDAAPGRRATPGSTAFVPPAMGLLIASEVARDLIR